MRRLIGFFRAWEPRAWAALLIVTAGLWGVFAIGEAVREGVTARWDRWLLEVFRRPDDPGRLRGPGDMADIARDITALGSVSVLTLATVGVAGFLRLLGKRHTARFLVLATLSGGLVVSAIKVTVDRPRPEVVPHLAQVTSASFPSGHSMMAAMTYLTLGGLVMAVVESRLLKMYVLTLAVALAILVGVSRVMLGVHYPSDVLGGWTMGLVWSEACWLVHAWLTGRLHHHRQLDETPGD